MVEKEYVGTWVVVNIKTKLIHGRFVRRKDADYFCEMMNDQCKRSKKSQVYVSIPIFDWE